MGRAFWLIVIVLGTLTVGGIYVINHLDWTDISPNYVIVD